MPAPTKHPDWATDETNNVEPPDAKKAAGWVPAEQPPSSWFNWWKNLVGLWVRWLEERADTNAADIVTVQGNVDDVAADLASLDAHAAKFDEPNTWEFTQTFDIDQADDPMFRSTKHAGNHGGSSGNVWKVQHTWLLTDGTNARVYSGAGGGSGNWCLTTNALWDPGVAGQVWSKDDDLIESNVLRCFNGELHFYGKAPGGGTWGPGAWDTARGVARVGDEVHAKGFQAASSGFNYEPAVTHWVEAVPSGGYNTFFNSRRLAPGEDVQYFFPRLPTGAWIGQVNVKVERFAGNDYEIYANITTVKNFTDETTPGATMSSLDSDLVSGATPKVENHLLSYGGLTVDNEFKVYWVRIFNKLGATSDLEVYGVQLGFTDPGPRNH